MVIGVSVIVLSTFCVLLNKRLQRVAFCVKWNKWNALLHMYVLFIVSNHSLHLATTHCSQPLVAISNHLLLIARSGCEQRVVANCNEWLLNATSGC